MGNAHVTDLAPLVVQHLDASSLCKSALCCQAVNVATKRETLWDKLLQQRWPAAAALAAHIKSSCRTVYQQRCIADQSGFLQSYVIDVNAGYRLLVEVHEAHSDECLFAGVSEIVWAVNEEDDDDIEDDEVASVTVTNGIRSKCETTNCRMATAIKPSQKIAFSLSILRCSDQAIVSVLCKVPEVDEDGRRWVEIDYFVSGTFEKKIQLEYETLLTDDLTDGLWDGGELRDGGELTVRFCHDVAGGAGEWQTCPHENIIHFLQQPGVQWIIPGQNTAPGSTLTLR